MSEASDRAIVSTTHQIDDLNATLAKVRALAEKHAAASWRSNYLLSVEYAEGMNQAGDEICAALDGQP